jgi:hypothetical protein
MMSPGKRLRIRRGGGGVDVGWGRLRRPRPVAVSAFTLPPRATQASPLHASTTPAPTGQPIFLVDLSQALAQSGPGGKVTAHTMHTPSRGSR